MPRTTIRAQFKPSDMVPQSGIYKVVHDSKRDSGSHEVTCVFGNKFPPCNHCGDHVRFVLTRAALHIEAHKYFVRKRQRS